MELSKIEIIEDECEELGINSIKCSLPENIKGIYYSDPEVDPVIILNDNIEQVAEASCVLAEELGHYHTSCGNLLTDKSVDTATIHQQEVRAKRWAVKRLVSLKNIIKAYDAGCNNLFETAEFLGVTEEFLLAAFMTYSSIYGKYKVRGRYIIYFDPPGIFKAI